MHDRGRGERSEGHVPEDATASGLETAGVAQAGDPDGEGAETEDQTYHIQRLVHERTVHLLLGLLDGIEGLLGGGVVGGSGGRVRQGLAGGGELVGDAVGVDDGLV